MWRTVSGVIFIAILFAFDVNGLDFKQYSDAELREVTFKDKNGNVKARVVPRSADDSEGAGVDDEDSKSTDGSGDTDEKTNSGVLGDQPTNVNNRGKRIESTKAIISPSPSVSIAKNAKGKTTQIASTSKHVVKTQTLYSTVESSTPSKTQLAKSSNQPIVIEPSSTVTSAQASSSASVTKSPSLLTTEVTTKSKTTTQPSTTSHEIPTTRPNVNKPTTESMSVVINGTKDPVVVTKRAGENGTFVATNVKSTPVLPTSKSTESSVNVKAHRDPTEKPKKTLFGFVTVEILIALLAGALFSILLVAFLVYRLKKRNEGSYELSETIALRPKELDEMGTKKEVFV